MTETLAQNIGAKADALAPLRHSVEMLRNGMSDAPDKFTVTMRAILAKHGEGAVRVRDLKASACLAVLAAVREALPLHLATIGPVFPVPKNKKAARLNSWQKIATQDPATIRKMSAANPGCNWGVVWNVIDVDTKDPKPSKARGTDTWAAHVAGNSEPDTRKALTPSGGVHYYIIDQLDNSISTVMGDGVDSKGAGKGYVVAPGSYVEANGKDIRASGFYKWANDRPVNSVPWIAAKFTDAKPAATVNADTAPGYPTVPLFDAENGAAMLATLKASDYREQQPWLDLGMSYHYATAGQGLHEFIAWSDTDTEYTGRTDDREGRWISWSRPDKVKDEYTFFKAVCDAGGAALVAKIKNDFANDPISDADLTDGIGEPDPIYPEPTSAKDLAAKVFPKRVEIVEGLILDGIVQTIDGDGGVGKSTVLMQASVAVAAGKQIFDRETSQRPVWFITHEDDEQDLQPVMMAMADELEVNLADLPLEVSALLDQDISIADIDDNGKIKLLAFYRYLDKMLATRRGSLIVLDCLADIAQMQEAGRLAPNAFFKTVMTGLCKRHGVSIIVLAHPSKAAMVSGAWYSGGTAYKTAVRHKLVMKLVDPKDIYGTRTLETLKKNWGKRSATITLTWQRGIFILDRDDPKAAEKSKVVIARILELIDGGHKVARNNQADGWTPKTLAGDIVDAEGGKLVNAKDVLKIMLAAERRGVLKYFEATRHGKAHYERGTAANDFEDGEVAELDGEGGQRQASPIST